MEPTGIAKFGPWEDNQPREGQFRRLVVFNDGSKGYEIYEYGTDGPINEPTPDPKLGNDPRQAADFLDYQKKAADLNKQPNPASQSESITAPANQEWLIRAGPNGIETIKNPNYKGPETEKPRILQTKHNDETGTTSVLVGTSAEDAVWKEIPGGPKSTTAEKGTWRKVSENVVDDQTTGQKKVVVIEENDVTGARREVSGSSTTIKEPDQPTMIDGKPYRAVKNEKGEVAGYEEITVQGSDRGRLGPQMPAGTHLGTIYSGIASTAEKIANDPDMTPQEKARALDRLEKLGTLMAEEDQAVLTSQQNTFSTQVSQRNANLTDQASRRNFIDKLTSDAFKEMSDMAQYMPASGGPDPAQGFLGRIMGSLLLANKFGGLKTMPDIAPGAAAQQVYGQQLQQPQQQAPMPQQQAGGGMPTINIINGVPQAPQSVAQAMPPNPALSGDVSGGLPRMPGGGYAPAGMQFTDQLRAPGYQAPGFMDEWAGE